MRNPTHDGVDAARRLTWSRIRKGLVLGVAVLAAGACTPMDDAMVAIFGRSMRNQVTYDPYEEPLLPAEGSVPFAAGNLPAARGEVNVGQPEAGDYLIPDFTQAQTANPNAELWASFTNPVPADEASLTRGREVYDRWCAVCHGPEGIGTGAYVLEKWPALAAYNLAGDVVQGYSDAYIYGMMRVGRGLMPSYGYQITHFDRWHIVNYVRQLQGQGGGGGAAAAGAQADSAADAAGGEGS